MVVKLNKLHKYHHHTIEMSYTIFEQPNGSLAYGRFLKPKAPKPIKTRVSWCHHPETVVTGVTVMYSDGNPHRYDSIGDLIFQLMFIHGSIMNNGVIVPEIGDKVVDVMR